MIEKKYNLSSLENITFFKDWKNFRQKAEDHFLNLREPWHRLLGKNFSHQICQKLKQGEVDIEENALQELYQKVTPLLDAGITFSVSLPLYVHYKIEVQEVKDGVKYRREGYYFLSKYGFIIIVNRGVVITAYFRNKSANDSYFTLFKSAWKYIKIKCDAGEYLDTKGQKDIFYRGLEMVNRENWAHCPNPNEKDKPRASRRYGFEKWLEETEEIPSKFEDKQ